MRKTLTRKSHVTGDVAMDEVQAVKCAAKSEINKMRKSLYLEIAEMEKKIEENEKIQEEV